MNKTFAKETFAKTTGLLLYVQRKKNAVKLSTIHQLAATYSPADIPDVLRALGHRASADGLYRDLGGQVLRWEDRTPVLIEAGMKQEAAMAQYARERRGTGKAVTSDEDSGDFGDHLLDLLLDGEIDLTAIAAHAQSHKAKAQAKQRQVNRRNKKKTTCSLPTQPSSTPDT